MLTLLSSVEVPEHIEKFYLEYKEIAQAVYTYARPSGRVEKVMGNTNLYEHAERGAIFYIEEGVFRLIIDDNMVRFYSESDFIVSLGDPGRNSSLISDFATEVMAFDKDVFMKTIEGHLDIFEKWTRLMELEGRINAFLASAYMRHNVVPDFTLKEYDEGDVIIKEGDDPRNIFEMVSGSADASRKGMQLGVIHEGEVFGEVSFFTGRQRTATVTALEKCMVRVIHEENFSDMIRHNPNFIISISKTLARRIVHLNQKVADNIAAIQIEFEEL